MIDVYAEIGFGNDSFFSTEFEEGENEYRIPKFILPQKIRGIYLRCWVVKTVFIFSTTHGFEMKKKSKNKLKILFGVSGTSAK